MSLEADGGVSRVEYVRWKGGLKQSNIKKGKTLHFKKGKKYFGITKSTCLILSALKTAMLSSQKQEDAVSYKTLVTLK